MNREDSAKFDEALTATLELFGKPPPSNAAMKRWWNALKPYPLAVVLHALTPHERRSTFAPKPKDIIEIIDGQDGRPEADEAWALALISMDEMETVIWTEEIAQARSTAQPIYNDGDKVGARVAFKKCYERLIIAARERQEPAKWSVSAGNDPKRREAVVLQAIELGQLTQQQARVHLPTIEMAREEAVTGLITGNIAEPDKPSIARAFLDTIRQIIKKTAVREQEKEDTARLKREAKQREFEQHQQQEVEKAEKLQKKARDEDD